MTRPRHGDGRSLLVVLLLACVPFGYLVARFDFVTDDAYISFRYARNFARGMGLRYNPGVEPPVEGYSNFLWVLLMGVVERLRLDPALWSRVLSTACGVGLLASFARLVHRRLGGDTTTTWMGTVFLATLPPVVVWATGGLATLPTALCVFLVYERLSVDPGRPQAVQAGLAALAAGLLRVDGAPFAALVLVICALQALSARDRSLLRAIRTAGLILVLGVAAHVLWRHSYYGELVPNTAHVKAGFSPMRLERGVKYVGSTLLTILSIPLALALSLFQRRCAERSLRRVALLFAAGTGAYAVAVGGDFMAFGRFLVVGMPFVALAFAVAVHGWLRRGKRGLAWSVTALALVLSLLPSFDRHPVPLALREKLFFRWGFPFQTEHGTWEGMVRRIEKWVPMGIAMKRVTEPGDSIVLAAIGAMGYHSELFVYDRNGLIDREVARMDTELRRSAPGHDKHPPPGYFLQFNPTFLQEAIAGPAFPRTQLALEHWDELPMAQLGDLERHLIDPELGLPPGSELWLVRYRPGARLPVDGEGKPAPGDPEDS